MTVEYFLDCGFTRFTTLFSLPKGEDDSPARGSLAHLHSLSNSPITTDEDTDFQTTLELARTYGLTFCDALYLELVRRRQSVLATLDGDLARAAVAEGLLLTTA